jgi:glucoamylase
MAIYPRQTADIWNANIERWTYVTDTDLARRFEIDGYYVRIAPPEVSGAA